MRVSTTSWDSSIVISERCQMPAVIRLCPSGRKTLSQIVDGRVDSMINRQLSSLYILGATDSNQDYI